MIGRNDICWCGSNKKWKKCHFPNEGTKSSIENLKKQYLQKHQILLKNDEEIQGIREASKLASQILDATCALAKAGVTTEELNQFAHKLHMEAGATPAPLRYGAPPFPKSICTSLNEVICHGIPSQRMLQEGDILNIDVTALLNGYYGDCSRMVVIGKTTPERQLVVDVSYECLMRSIAILKPGLPIYAIGDVIEDYAASKNCSVVNQFVGHGVGLHFHENPQVPHCRNKIDIPLVPGMTFTIEPMINAGVRTAIIDEEDKWTARTKDGRTSAQWEHTLLITDTGHEILTRGSVFNAKAQRLR
jgi:methionyl aminopeptidase